MTNRELIDKLQTFPDDLEIVTADQYDRYLYLTDEDVETILLAETDRGDFYEPTQRGQKVNLYIRI